MRRALLLSTSLGLSLALTGCPTGGGGDDDDADGVAVLGSGSHSIDSVLMEVFADEDDGLGTPRDLEFNPAEPGQLWIVNRDSDSAVILTDAGTDDQESIFRGDTFGSAHFLAQPSALAFGDDGNWASIHETDDLTQGPNGTPEDFMGPTLWDDNLDVFDGGHGGHLDMLHNSPNGMGIAWEEGNTFWVFDGYHDSLTRYFFNNDHGYGGADHSDGEIERHVEGEVRWREDIPSHMEYDHSEDWLYFVDTGNNRIGVHDARSGAQAGNIGPNYDGIQRLVAFEGGDCWTHIDGEAVSGMGRPSGLALWDADDDGTPDMLFTNDNRTGIIFAFDMEGQLVDYLETGFEDGALMGMEFDQDGNLWLVNALENEVLRISPQ